MEPSPIPHESGGGEGSAWRGRPPVPGEGQAQVRGRGGLVTKGQETTHMVGMGNAASWVLTAPARRGIAPLSGWERVSPLVTWAMTP